MPILNITINSKTHQIACSNGDEERLLSLAKIFESKVKDLLKSFPNSKESTLYLIASLTILDELQDNKTQVTDNAHITQDLITEIFQALTHKIELLTDKVERL